MNCYDIHSQSFKDNPYPVYEKMRRETPVYCHEFEDGGRVWHVTRYQEAEAILRDHKRFVKNERSAMNSEELACVGPPTGLARLLEYHMLNIDPPDHTRLRALVNKAFTSRMVRQLQGRVQLLADALIDRVMDQQGMDLMNDYAFPLPIRVITELLGVPSTDQDRFRQWSHAFVAPAYSEEEMQRHNQLLLEFTDYLRDIFNQRRQEPQDDLTTALLEAEEAGDKLSEGELFSMVILLLVAGHETTVNLIGNGTLALLKNPERRAELQQNPSLMPAAIEEFLRYDGPVDRSTVRWTAEDVELGSQVIPRRSMVIVMLSAANRDPAHFDHPDSLDFHREDNRHLGFGLGIHYCVGAPLARMEGEVALNTLFRRLPKLRLAVSEEELTWQMVPLFRGVKAMPVRWD